MPLEQRINLGPTLVNQLKSVGITNFEELEELGSMETWLKIQKIDSSACINRLYALEGALQNIRWHDLSEEDKSKLKEFYNQHKLK